MLPTAFRVALRYFFSKKKKNFIHILTNLSMLVVAVGTMALIVVLSIFNGLEDLTRQLHTARNPELKVSPRLGKTFGLSAKQATRLQDLAGVEAVTKVIEDNALLRYGDNQAVVKFKGVAPNFQAQYDLSPYLQEGKLALYDEKKQPQALLGSGVQYQLAVGLRGNPVPMVFWYPQRNARISVADPSKNFRRRPIHAGGVLAVEQQFDQSYVLVPLAFARRLTGYDSAVSYLEIRTTPEHEVTDVQRALQSVFPSEHFHIQNADEQQEIVLRAFRIERLFAFLAFSCVIAVASFNIFFSLAMLVIEKRKDLAVLRSFGASRRFLRGVFLWEGALIALIGTGLGLLLGLLIVLGQQEFGVVKLGVETSVVSAYPVALRPSDFLFTALAVLTITMSATLIPARNATRVQPKDWL